MVQGADMAPVDLVGVGLEMLVAQRLQAFQHRVDLELRGHEGVEGFGIVGGAAGGHGVLSGVSCIVLVQSDSLMSEVSSNEYQAISLL